ncbi:hypothetical protein EH223_11770 [candidate division KSB1 bacterium]|nr:hypothetical protein [candidate division KSB1 bacterium]RQW02680.1 MAG: hypothetical protein EH223_11770 [candidate division KSB1 bacterium]
MIEKLYFIVADLVHWIQEHNIALLILGVTSLFTFVGTLILVPVLIVRLPTDYFAHPGRRRKPWLSLFPLLRLVLLIGKNLLGLVLLSAGILMLVLPGQGILTILIGLTLIDFPGKFAFERWLVMRKPVQQTVNWLRHRAGRPPLILPRDRRRSSSTSL